MPIVIKKVQWQQSATAVSIKVPAAQATSSTVDVFISKGYVKASFGQFFFEALLQHAIDVTKSSCTIVEHKHIVFELTKLDGVQWTDLEADVPKAEKLQLKTFYINEEHERAQKETNKLTEKKCELKRVAVREQIDLDAVQRKNIETIKKEEKQKALQDVGKWRDKSTDLPVSVRRPQSGMKKVEKKPKDVPIPPPRATRSLTVEFTPREFSTPCRESRLEEENEWLRKQAEARRSVGFISEDIRPEERNPQSLKHKGDEFLRARNLLGAVSAYSFGIKISDKFSDLYVARSEAHLALGNYHKTVQDCSRALELMKPEVPQNLRERAACIGRRGVALLKMGIHKEGIDELKASLRLIPNEFFSSELEEALDKKKSDEEEERIN